MPTETTNVQQVEFDNLEDLLGVGGENIMVPASDTNPDAGKPQSVFSTTKTDTTFLDKPIDKPVETTAGASGTGTDTPPAPADDLSLQDLNDLIDQASQEEGDTNKGGRPSLVKDVMIETANKLIEKGLLFPFDDGKKLEDYSQADWEELLEANFKEREEKLLEEVPASFYQTLPNELKKAYEYIANGGTDLKSMFKALAAAEEIRELSIETEEGQEDIVRTYLQATRYGTPEEIEEEIIALRDRGDLETKAERFKPRLDQMQEQIIQQRLAHQEEARRKQQEQAQVYQDNVYNVLNTGELNGVKLDAKVQNLLFSGLTQPNYSSITGKQTNMLGHLLEKYQWTEPRHDLIAEALWLLADPDGYKSKIKEQGSKAAIEDTVRKLKTEEASKITSSVSEERETRSTHSAPARTLPRTKRSFFGR